jgi:eukaryotic-like serine/threonine-protein kinase
MTRTQQPHVRLSDAADFDATQEGRAPGRSKPRMSRPVASEDPTVLAGEVERLLHDDDGPARSQTSSPASFHEGEASVPAHERFFGGYELLQRIAFGGMGEVYLARRGRNEEQGTLSFARPIVIKRILAHMRNDERQRRMFLEEAKLQAQLRSPHVVQIHDVGEVDGSVFLAMEHVHGPSLRALIDVCRRRREHMPLGHVVDMMIQAATGLADAHMATDRDTGAPLNVVHRDINPHNILVTYDGVVKIIDFGIAKSDLREQHTETGTIKGKFAYMSPEQSAAEALDQRSDVFALGICLYELATLVNPFRKSNVVLSLEAIQRTPAKPIEQLRPAAHFLEPVLRRALAKAREDRYPSAAAFAEDLRRCQVDGLVPAPKEAVSLLLRRLFAAELQRTQEAMETRAPARVRTPSPSPAPSPSSAPSSRASTMPALDVATSSMFQPPPSVSMPPPASLQPPAATAATRVPMVHAPASSTRAWVVGGVVVVGVVAAIAFALWPRAADVPVAVEVQDAGTTPTPTTPVTPPTILDNSDVVDAGSGPAIIDAVALVQNDNPIEPAQKPKVANNNNNNNNNKGKSKTPPVPDAAKPADEGESSVARVTVSADGFVIKGSRQVRATGTTRLVVDDAEAPFATTMTVQWNDGKPTLGLMTTPWAIAIIDGVGKGKTPLSSIGLVPGKKTRVVLRHPDGKTMDLSILVATP